MSKAYKVIEVVGTSEKSVSDAIDGAVARAGKTLSGIGWFTVDEIRGRVQDDKVAEYQVTVKVGFRLKD